MLRHIFIIGILASLTACAPFKPNTTKAGICNQLNSEIIFTGSTSNIRKANIENAKEPLIARNYDERCE